MDITLALYGWLIIALVLLPIQLFITAPYGRHSVQTWGPMLSNRLGWLLMELVALLVLWFMFAWSILQSHGPISPVSWLGLLLWSVHYINRGIIYPVRLRTAGKRMPVVVMLMAIAFNSVNAWSNGYFLAHDMVGDIDVARIGFGVLLFVIGLTINVLSDNVLLRLRENATDGYQIPRSTLFRRVSCPNFLGELIEWIGFAVVCWNLPALVFVVWTAANLIPRAIAHHRWYQKQFNEYPSDRKAIIPFVV